jgi:predicted dehydrogenase
MEQVGFGVIGTGIVGGAWHAHVYATMPQSKLVAVCDLNETRASEIADKYGAKAVYTDYHQLLDNPEVKAVSIATPDFAHREIAVAAAQAGKHILVEKPLATSVEDAEAIVNAANKAMVKLMVDFHNRVNPPFASAKQSLLNGELGKPVYIYARLSNTTWVATQMLSWASKSSALWFLGSHVTDLAHWLLDDEPKRVYAVTRSGILKEMGVDTQDFHVAIVEFKNGAVLTLENAWILPETEPNVFNFKFELLGSKGSLYINTSDHRLAQKFTNESASLPDVLGITFGEDSPRLSGFVLEAIARFVDAVANDMPVLASGEDGLLVTRTLCAIQDSAASGKPVEL